jgi:hypothetical protein
MIPSPVGPYHPKVGWNHSGAVQIGVEIEGQRSIFWTLVDAERLGGEVRKHAALDFPDDADLGASILNTLDTIADGGGPNGSYAGVWSDLDRDACNRLIRTLRKARDAAFGADA